MAYRMWEQTMSERANAYNGAMLEPFEVFTGSLHHLLESFGLEAWLASSSFAVMPHEIV
jgi:hypothetical protein